jgi:hypothetical protein
MSKRKPHNPTKRLITQCQIAVKDLALSMVQSWHEKGVELRKYETGKPIKIGQSVAQALDRCAFKWAILLIVYAQDANGKRKFITDWQRLAAPYRHCDLVEWLHKEHSAMIRNCKAAVVDAGWIALPVPPAYQDETTEAALVDKLTALMDYEEVYQ